MKGIEHFRSLNGSGNSESERRMKVRYERLKRDNLVRVECIVPADDRHKILAFARHFREAASKKKSNNEA